MIKTETIKQWLDQGYAVRSKAIGRIGTVIATDFNHVRVVPPGKSGAGITTFERGDPVTSMVKDGTVWIVNASQGHC